MDNINIWTDISNNQQVTITNPDGSFTSMLKSDYDAQIAAQSTLPSNSSTPRAGAN